MNWNHWIRQIHRWMSLAFTAGVIVNIVAATRGEPPAWVYALAGLPLVLLQLTGLYLFILPYAGKWRSERPSATT